jgi:multisubunit Na+/H+ antiporter MnhC subunit
MNTPGLRHWSNHCGWKITSGLLIGLGILVIVGTQLLRARLSKIGFAVGLMIILVGLVRHLVYSIHQRHLALRQAEGRD